MLLEKLCKYTAYKVELYGGQVIIVNPSSTSQKCSRCVVVKTKEESLTSRYTYLNVISVDWLLAVIWMRLKTLKNWFGTDPCWGTASTCPSTDKQVRSKEARSPRLKTWVVHGSSIASMVYNRIEHNSIMYTDYRTYNSLKDYGY